MFRRLLIVAAGLLLALDAAASAAPTHLVMLGVSHSAQLVNPNLNPQKGVRDNVGAAAACRAPAPWRNALSLPRPMHGIDPCPAPSAVAGNRESQPPAR